MTEGRLQSKEASILWSHHEETRELHGERDNVRNSARCTQAGHARPGWTTSRRGQDSPWKSQVRRTEVRPWCGEPSDRGRLKNRTGFTVHIELKQTPKVYMYSAVTGWFTKKTTFRQC